MSSSCALAYAAEKKLRGPRDKGLFVVTMGEGAEQRWWMRRRGQTAGRWTLYPRRAHEYTSRRCAQAVADEWEGARIEEVLVADAITVRRPR